MMKISYDKTVDVLYIAIKDRPAIATEVCDGVFVRTNEDEVIGVTILGFKEKFMNFKERFLDPPVAENPFRTAVLEIQNRIFDPPDTRTHSEDEDR